MGLRFIQINGNCYNTEAIQKITDVISPTNEKSYYLITISTGEMITIHHTDPKLLGLQRLRLINWLIGQIGEKDSTYQLNDN